MKNLTNQINKVYIDTRHSQKSDKDYRVLVIEFKNGYKYEDYRLSNEAAFILDSLASSPAGNH